MRRKNAFSRNTSSHATKKQKHHTCRLDILICVLSNKLEAVVALPETNVGHVRQTSLSERESKYELSIVPPRGLYRTGRSSSARGTICHQGFNVQITGPTGVLRVSSRA
jgi:hypothetical protein